MRGLRNPLLTGHPLLITMKYNRAYKLLIINILCKILEINSLHHFWVT
jgi:hypothetical protein